MPRSVWLGQPTFRTFPDGNCWIHQRCLNQAVHGPAGAWDFAASAAEPLFTGGKLQANVRMAEAQQQQPAAYQQTVQSAFRDASEALVAYQRPRGAGTTGTPGRAAQDSARLAHVRYDGGSTAYLESPDQRKQLPCAELALSQARLNEMISLVQIYGALGGGWQQ